MIFKITPCTCELFDPKIEKSPSYGDFENFPTPNLTSNFETHKNVGDSFAVYIYVHIYKYSKIVNKIPMGFKI